MCLYLCVHFLCVIIMWCSIHMVPCNKNVDSKNFCRDAIAIWHLHITFISCTTCIKFTNQCFIRLFVHSRQDFTIAVTFLATILKSWLVICTSGCLDGHGEFSLMLPSVRKLVPQCANHEAKCHCTLLTHCVSLNMV